MDKLTKEELCFILSCIQDRIDKYERELRYDAHNQYYILRVEDEYLPYARNVIAKIKHDL